MALKQEGHWRSGGPRSHLHVSRASFEGLELQVHDETVPSCPTPNGTAAHEHTAMYRPGRRTSLSARCCAHLQLLPLCKWQRCGHAMRAAAVGRRPPPSEITAHAHESPPLSTQPSGSAVLEIVRAHDWQETTTRMHRALRLDRDSCCAMVQAPRASQLHVEVSRSPRKCQMTVASSATAGRGSSMRASVSPEPAEGRAAVRPH